MFCQECGTRFTEGATACSQCGKDVGQGQNSGTSTPPNPDPGQDRMASFLSFDIMITPMIMKIIYIVGSVVIVLASLVAMFTGGIAGFFGGLIGGAIALVFFRVWCEILILFFKMRGDIQQIKDGTTQK